MNTQKVAHWVQIATGAAMLVGIGLVVWELEQSKDVATAQLTSDGYDQYNQSLVPVMGESPSLALAKACSDPQSLTIDELIILGSYFSIVMSPIDRAYKIEQRSGLYRGLWLELLQADLSLVLLTTAGRTWWSTEKAFYPPEFQSVANAIVESSPTVGECYLIDWQRRIDEASSIN